jgi:hypothetical protein
MQGRQKAKGASFWPAKQALFPVKVYLFLPTVVLKRALNEEAKVLARQHRCYDQGNNYAQLENTKVACARKHTAFRCKSPSPLLFRAQHWLARHVAHFWRAAA